jgi:DNA integrity scanning protein DisA with diadenylate cyclase activity
MLTLDQLISEATALPDSDKAILIDKIVESMATQIDRDILIEGVKKAQERIAEIDRGAVQTIPGELALEQIRQLSEKLNMNFTQQPCKNMQRPCSSLPSKTDTKISSTP